MPLLAKNKYSNVLSFQSDCCGITGPRNYKGSAFSERALQEFGGENSVIEFAVPIACCAEQDTNSHTEILINCYSNLDDANHVHQEVNNSFSHPHVAENFLHTPTLHNYCFLGLFHK